MNRLSRKNVRYCGGRYIVAHCPPSCFFHRTMIRKIQLIWIMSRLQPLATRLYRIGLSVSGHDAIHPVKWTHSSIHKTSHCGSTLLDHSFLQCTQKSSFSTNSKLENPLAPSSSSNNGDPDTYAVAKITPLTTAMPNSPRSLKITTKTLSIEQILEEAPGTHARDFFSLSLTSVGEAESRKRRARYSVNKIHPWFVLPRETEIIVSIIISWFVRRYYLLIIF